MAGGPSSPALVVPETVDEPPPCELPAWCSEPTEGTQGADVEIWRVPAAPPGLQLADQPQATRLVLGRRAWILIGRPHLQGPKGGRQPDIQLQTARASRKHALLLRNFHAQIFVMDLGSTHGTFLGRQRLPPHTPREWKQGVSMHFADTSIEIFENRPTRLVTKSALALMPSQNWFDAAGSSSSSNLQGIAAIAAATAAADAAKAAAAQSAASFSGTRRMMQAELGEQLRTEPLNQTKAIEDVPLHVDPLYPGDWEVPADGLSEIRKDSGGVLERAEQADQQAAAVSVSVALKLEERLRKIREEREAIARGLDQEREKERNSLPDAVNKPKAQNHGKEHRDKDYKERSKKEKEKKDKGSSKEEKEKERELDKRERERQQIRDEELGKENNEKEKHQVMQSDSDNEQVLAIENGDVHSDAEQKGGSGLNILALNKAMEVAEDEMLLLLIKRLFAEGSKAQIHELGIWLHSDLIKSRPHLLPEAIRYYAEAMQPAASSTAIVPVAEVAPSEQEDSRDEETEDDEGTPPSRSHGQKPRKRERSGSNHLAEEKHAKGDKRQAKSRSHSKQHHAEAARRKESREDDKSPSTSRRQPKDKKREKADRESRKHPKEEKRRKGDKDYERSRSRSQGHAKDQKSAKDRSKQVGSCSPSKTRIKDKKHKNRKHEPDESCSEKPAPPQKGRGANAQTLQADIWSGSAAEAFFREQMAKVEQDRLWLAEEQSWRGMQKREEERTVAEPLEGGGHSLAERKCEATSQGKQKKEERSRTSEKVPKEHRKKEAEKKSETCGSSAKGAARLFAVACTETALHGPKSKARNAFDGAPSQGDVLALTNEPTGSDRKRSHSLHSSSAKSHTKKKKDRKRSSRRGKSETTHREAKRKKRSSSGEKDRRGKRRKSSPSSPSRRRDHRQRDRSKRARSSKHQSDRHESRGDSACEEAQDEAVRKYAALSEDELMELGPSRLVECFKLLIQKKRIENPTFKHSRLRDAYADALRLLLEQPVCYDESSSAHD